MVHIKADTKAFILIDGKQYPCRKFELSNRVDSGKGVFLITAESVIDDAAITGPVRLVREAVTNTPRVGETSGQSYARTREARDLYARAFEAWDLYARTCDARDLYAFAKTGAPPVADEGGSGWVSSSPTYSATLAARGEPTTRCVPRMRPQEPWDDCTSLEGVKFVTARPKSLNDFATECHKDNQHWWHDPATGKRLYREQDELFMLVVSELSECMEGERKGLTDTHLPHRRNAEVELADAIIRLADIAGSKQLNLDDYYAAANPAPISSKSTKGSQLLRVVNMAVKCSEGRSRSLLENNIVWTLKLIEMYAELHGYDVWGAVAEKREYNRTRADHKAEARLAANGKKF